jgi:hypothetical protein
MEQHIFKIVLIIEGATEKVSQFVIPLKFESVLNNLCFKEQNALFFENCIIKDILFTYFFVFMKLFYLPFQSCPM